MVPPNVEQFLDLLKKKRLLKKYHLKKLSLFGSFARGEKANDIDILVRDVKDYNSLIEFKKELELLTKKRVDIMIEKFANPIVLYRASKDMIDVS
ncbi:MAG TPA: nucleotidyltransferase domain-containing protein [Candidatus Deferrimicrobium sp.]|nr:nucleotidyltransferase domain-containing protein [Candidatus Deferrimicrobium sp.]